MTHAVILEQLKRLFPQFAEKIYLWFPNGRNCIRVMFEDRQEFIFTYNKEKEWSFETISCYINRIKKEEKR